MKKVKTSQFCECLRAKQNALSLTWTQGSFVHYLALILSLFKNISLHKSFTRNLHKIAAMKITLSRAQSIHFKKQLYLDGVFNLPPLLVNNQWKITI